MRPKSSTPRSCLPEVGAGGVLGVGRACSGEFVSFTPRWEPPRPTLSPLQSILSSSVDGNQRHEHLGAGPGSLGTPAGLRTPFPCGNSPSTPHTMSQQSVVTAWQQGSADSPGVGQQEFWEHHILERVPSHIDVHT